MSKVPVLDWLLHFIRLPYFRTKIIQKTLGEELIFFLKEMKIFLKNLQEFWLVLLLLLGFFQILLEDLVFFNKESYF